MKTPENRQKNNTETTGENESDFGKRVLSHSVHGRASTHVIYALDAGSSFCSDHAALKHFTITLFQLVPYCCKSAGFQ